MSYTPAQRDAFIDYLIDQQLPGLQEKLDYETEKVSQHDRGAPNTTGTPAYARGYHEARRDKLAQLVSRLTPGGPPS